MFPGRFTRKRCGICPFRPDQSIFCQSSKRGEMTHKAFLCGSRGSICSMIKTVRIHCVLSPAVVGKAIAGAGFPQSLGGATATKEAVGRLRHEDGAGGCGLSSAKMSPGDLFLGDGTSVRGTLFQLRRLTACTGGLCSVRCIVWVVLRIILPIICRKSSDGTSIGVQTGFILSGVEGKIILCTFSTEPENKIVHWSFVALPSLTHFNAI